MRGVARRRTGAIVVTALVLPLAAVDCSNGGRSATSSQAGPNGPKSSTTISPVAAPNEAGEATTSKVIPVAPGTVKKGVLLPPAAGVYTYDHHTSGITTDTTSTELRSHYSLPV